LGLGLGLGLTLNPILFEDSSFLLRSVSSPGVRVKVRVRVRVRVRVEG